MLATVNSWMISVAGMGGHNKQTSNVICCLLMGMSLIGSSLAQTTVIRDGNFV